MSRSLCCGSIPELFFSLTGVSTSYGLVYPDGAALYSGAPLSAQLEYLRRYHHANPSSEKKRHITHHRRGNPSKSQIRFSIWPLLPPNSSTHWIVVPYGVFFPPFRDAGTNAGLNTRAFLQAQTVAHNIWASSLHLGIHFPFDAIICRGTCTDSPHDHLNLPSPA